MAMPTNATNHHKTESVPVVLRKPGLIVLLMWIGGAILAAWAAVGPVHRTDIPPYWSFEFFIKILLGPLAIFFGSLKPSVSDCIIAILCTVVLLAGTLFYIRRPGWLTATLLFALVSIWLFFGMCVAYAWV